MRSLRYLTPALLTTSALAGSIGFGPSPYLSAADSPFAGLPFAQSYLENFEDGLLNSTGVSASGGIAIGPGAQTDSVDGDDGAIDGSGVAGSSWFSAGTVQSFTFTFDAVALGGLPTHAGIVWTDVGTGPVQPGVDQVTFEARDGGGNLILTIGPSAVGDGSTFGATAEDRFFGVNDPDGIGSITISMAASTDWEVDHLQYGIIPEPATAAGAALGLLALIRRR